MNDRIKALLNVCGMPNEQLMTIYNDPNQTFYMDQFAELIVKECINICTTGDIEKPMGNYYAKQIEKHFGLKKYDKTIYDEISWRSDKDRE